MKKTIITLLLSAALCSVFAGCTSTEPASDNSQNPDESTVAISSAVSRTEENSDLSQTRPTTFSLWNSNFGVPISAVYQSEHDSATKVYKTQDAELISKLIEAVKGIDLESSVEERVSGDYTCIEFQFDIDAENEEDPENLVTIEFEGDYLLRNNKCYKVSGFDTLKAVLIEFAEKGTQLTPKSGDASSPSAPESDPSVVHDSSSESSQMSDVSENVSGVSEGEPPLYSWDNRNGKLVEVKFRYMGEAESDYFMTDDEQMLTKLTAALDGINVTGESDKRYSDSGIILLYTQENGTGRLDFEHGGLLVEGTRYEVEGYQALADVLEEIKEAYPEWSKKYDETIHRMSVVENRVQEITTSNAYENGDTEKKREMIMPVLRKLEKEGYIKEGSIYDSGDSISYSYIDGAAGGIMLKGFDPMMN